MAVASVELKMTIEDNKTPDIHALGSNHMLFNASAPMQHRSPAHASIQEHTAHTSESQISVCEGQEPKA